MLERGQQLYHLYLAWDSQLSLPYRLLAGVLRNVSFHPAGKTQTWNRFLAPHLGRGLETFTGAQSLKRDRNI